MPARIAQAAKPEVSPCDTLHERASCDNVASLATDRPPWIPVRRPAACPPPFSRAAGRIFQIIRYSARNATLRAIFVRTAKRLSVTIVAARCSARRPLQDFCHQSPTYTDCLSDLRRPRKLAVQLCKLLHIFKHRGRSVNRSAARSNATP